MKRPPDVAERKRRATEALDEAGVGYAAIEADDHSDEGAIIVYPTQGEGRPNVVECLRDRTEMTHLGPTSDQKNGVQGVRFM